jgi:hypothetical protein
MKPLRSTAVRLFAVLLSLVLAPLVANASTVPVTPTQDEVSIQFGDAPDHAYTADFFPGADHDPSITTPDEILGTTHGSRLAHHAEVLGAFRLWAAQSDRVTLRSMGKTHEGRELVVAVITTPQNHARIEEIQGNLAKLAKPAGLSDANASQLIRTAPAVAWMAYSIHGDELSGTDASLAVGYHLTADRSAETRALLNEVVVVIDPCMNPDGRERIIGMVEQSAGYTPSLNYSSMHRGRWPYGRGNHYLFDMNRDWMGGSQPETRARWRTAREWNPQLFVDSHEMGSLDTFLFYPKANPIHPDIPKEHQDWMKVFAAGAARAFDAQGWSYYTREWADGWAPFYSDSWGALAGAIGILYEQAGIQGFQVRRASGEILTYREAVHHQVGASFANLKTLKENRVALLKDYLAAKRRNIAASTEGNDEWLVVLPEDSSRMHRLTELLDGQGIRYFHNPEELTLEEAQSARGASEDSLTIPVGCLLVPARQPRGPFVRAYFDFDARIDAKTLKEEREQLERENPSKMYDMTAWSLPHAYNLNAWWGKVSGSVRGLAAGYDSAPRAGLRTNSKANGEVYAWVVDGHDDSSVAFAARAMEAGLQLNVSDRDFETGKTSWSRGSILIRRSEQDRASSDVETLIHTAALATDAVAHRIYSGRAPGEGPDLGGGHFHLLSRPRVALLANNPVSSDTYGHLWHQLDVELGVPFTILDAQLFGRADLRRYNVLILPPGNLRSLLASQRESIEDWVRGGGTLIGVGSTAALLTQGKEPLSSVRLRRDALEELDEYERAVERERNANDVVIDEELLWEGATEPAEEEDAEEEEKESSEDEAPIKERDAWMRRFSPSGVNLLADVNKHHWLTAGCGDEMPIAFSGSNVYLTKNPVETAIRFGPAKDLRLAGLLWPEARERIADSAYLTRERKGNGQIVLFANVPTFRGYHIGTARLFSNAVIYGPGLGANQALGW